MGTDCPTGTSWYWTRTHSFSSSTFMPGTMVARSWASEYAAATAATPPVTTTQNFDRFFIWISQSTLWPRTPSNGEVEGPDDHASQRPRAQTDQASRPPPTIVRRPHQI